MRLATPIAAAVLLALAVWALAPVESCFGTDARAAGAPGRPAGGELGAPQGGARASSEGGALGGPEGGALGLPTAGELAPPAAGPTAAWESATLRGGGPQFLALLVGIDDYPEDVEGRFADLSGCVRDVEAAARLLRERFGFPADSIRILRDEEATHEGIVRAFHDWLIARATPETEVVFWYSGHGSRVPDTSGLAGAEAEGLDSTLLAWDSRRGGLDGAYDLTDDELGSLLAALGRKTQNVTLVTDSCHSASLPRGAGTVLPTTRGDRGKGTQAFEPERVRAFWPQDVPLRDDVPPEQRALPEGYVHVAACLQSQEAHEIPATSEQGVPEAHGALSFFLTEVLKEARPGTSFRRIADEAGQRLAAHVANQSVAYEGAVDRELFGSRFEPPPPGYVARAGDGSTIRVEAGRLHGLREGSRLEVRANLGDEVLGTATVKELGTVSAQAAWDAAPPEGLALGTALRALETSRPAGQDPLLVRAADDELAALLAEDEFARVVRGPAAASAYQLVREPDGAAALYAQGELRIWLRSPQELAREEETRESLHAALGDELRYRALCDLASFDGDLVLEARFREPTDEELERLRSLGVTGSALEGVATPAGPAAAGNELLVRGGASAKDLRLLYLDVTNRAEEPVYVAALSLTEDRARNAIHPHRSDPHPGPLAPGETRSIAVGVVVNPKWTLERPMRDRYVVVASRAQQVDFGAFEDGPRLRGGDAAPVPEVLEAAFDLPLTRGRRPVPRSRSGADVGVQVVDLLVE